MLYKASTMQFYGSANNNAKRLFNHQINPINETKHAHVLSYRYQLQFKYFSKIIIDKNL